MVPDDALGAVEAAIRELQPRAVLYRTTHSEVDPSTVLGTDLFDFEEARRQQGWKRALAEGGGGTDGEREAHADDHGSADSHSHSHDHGDASAAETHGVESFVYRATRPFHPERFDAWLDDWRGDVIRAKGFAWVTSRPDEVVGVSQAGPAVQAGPIGEWGDDAPATRLVFIGRDVDEAAITAQLDDCLAAEEAATWEPSDDPFPRGSG